MRALACDDIEDLQGQIDSLQERAAVAERNLQNVARELNKEIRLVAELQGNLIPALVGPNIMRIYQEQQSMLERIRGWAEFHKVEAGEAGEQL